MGVLSPKGKGHFGEKNVAARAHCKVMVHSTVYCAKAAESIDNSTYRFKWRLCGPTEPYIRWGCRSPKGKGKFSGLSGLFKNMDNLRCTGRCSVAATGIIQSPTTSCSRKMSSVCQASANSIPNISGRRRCVLSAAKGWWDCTSWAKSDIYYYFALLGL